MADKYNNWFAKLLGLIFGYKRYAITLGQTARYSVSKEAAELSPAWIAHENRHKEQYARDGVVCFLCKYVWYLIRYGYKNNPYEVDAREAAAKI